MRALAVAVLLSLSQASPDPGRLVDAGGHLLYLNCAGAGSPTVVVEYGLGDASTNWLPVQREVAAFTRICTYDRGGYARSEPGPMPRTFAQIAFELRKALASAGERGPFVLVGHSFGGGPVRQFAFDHPRDVAGLVLAEIVAEHQFIRMGSHAGKIGDGAKGRTIPAPREGTGESLASASATLEAVEDSQREWSAEYFARWAATPQNGTLGRLPLIVLTRSKGGYGSGLDRPEAELEQARLDAQRALALLSTTGAQRIIDAGHNLHLEARAAVVAAIRDVIAIARKHR